MLEPPVLAGAANEIRSERLEGVTTTLPGTPGIVRGVTETELETAPNPAALTARTRTEYLVPFVRPEMVPVVLANPNWDGTNAVQVELPFNEY